MVHFSNLDVARAEADYAGSVGQPPGSGAVGSYARFIKRGLDIVVVLLAAPLVVPVVLLLGLLIARDGGPAFYVQDRVGRGGRVFRIWKLRSMVVGAERQQGGEQEARPEGAGAEAGPGDGAGRTQGKARPPGPGTGAHRALRVARVGRGARGPRRAREHRASRPGPEAAIA